MGRKRKTRREKIMSDERISPVHAPQSSVVSSLSDLNIAFHSPSRQTNSSPGTQGHAYVLQDVRKTLIVTFFLLVGNLILFFLIQKNIFTIQF